MENRDSGTHPDSALPTQSDLVERLRDATPPHYGKCVQAADLIEQQSAEITRLRRHCEAMADALDAADRQLCAAFQIIHPNNPKLLEGSLVSIRRPLEAYRGEKGA
jgi:hypothetical protein